MVLLPLGQGLHLRGRGIRRRSGQAPVLGRRPAQEPEAARLDALIDPLRGIDRSSLVSEFNERRLDLYFNLYGPTGSEPLIPTAQSPALALDFDFATAFETWLAARGQSDPLADPDGNGWTELETYIFAGDLRPRTTTLAATWDDDQAAISFTLRDTPDATVALELCADLSSWQEAIADTDYQVITDLPAGDGSRDVTLRLLHPHDSRDHLFCRLRASVTQP